MSKVWLVTGSASGLGRSIAEAVLASGDRLVATARDPRRLEDLVKKYGDQVGTPGNPPGATGQDAAKIKRYANYLEFAYQQANGAVEAILNAIGSQHGGEPRRDVFVVSDHGMAPFHTAVSLRNLLANAGVNVNLLGIRTTGPAANVYVNLQGREAGGTVSPDNSPTGYAALVALQKQEELSAPAGRAFSTRAPRPFRSPPT